MQQQQRVNGHTAPPPRQSERSERRQRNKQIRNADNRPIHNHMSYRQLSYMDIFWQQDPHFVLPMGQCLKKYHQGTFDSLARRHYIELRPRLKGFVCTEFGWEVKRRWEEGCPAKQHSSSRFGAFLRRENPHYLDGKFRVLESEDDVTLERKPPVKVVDIRHHKRVA